MVQSILSTDSHTTMESLSFLSVLSVIDPLEIMTDSGLSEIFDFEFDDLVTIS